MSLNFHAKTFFLLKVGLTKTKCNGQQSVTTVSLFLIRQICNPKRKHCNQPKILNFSNSGSFLKQGDPNLTQLGYLTLDGLKNIKKSLIFSKSQRSLRSTTRGVNIKSPYFLLNCVLVLSQLGYLTLDCVKKYPKKSDFLKKLAFAEVYNFDSNNQVTLHFTLLCLGSILVWSFDIGLA